ncbi:copper transporter [Mycobacterium sp. MYCO198283]|uniref:copper transporter n=1 Tax=Mycobacterium sp. MYCO198283 TaxID=2883505 RepID=UPI001E34C119|nr:copper transporter [Mycobacterium sp. MYCO198283]MCG5433108.1 copper transporter [Mycobacterium sp. MYCO198283]
MITLRHHAISLAAVFLALAIGVVLGSGLLSDTLLAGLRNDKRDLQHQIGELTDRNNALNERLAAASDFDTVMAGRMVRGALADKTVLLFTTPDASTDVVDRMTTLVGDAGGRVTGTVALTEQFVDANTAEKLRSVVASSVLPAGTSRNATLVDQGSQAGDLLGIALQRPRRPAPPVDPAQRDTVLAALRETGFVSYPDGGVEPADLALVVTGGGLGAEAGNQGSTVARFAAALAPHGSGTLVLGTQGCATGTAAVAVTRSDPSLAGSVSTVDNGDVESGRITAVLALRQLLDGTPPAQYGTGQGAAAVTVPE